MEVSNHVEVDPGSVNLVDGGSGKLALHYAAMEGKLRVVDYLINHDTLIDARDNDGHTALSLAIVNGHSQVVERLLVRGANPVVANNQGDTPLIIGVSRGLDGLVEALLEKQVVGDSIDAINQDGRTALWWACFRGDKKMVKQLIDAGSDVGGTIGTSLIDIAKLSPADRWDRDDIILMIQVS